MYNKTLNVSKRNVKAYTAIIKSCYGQTNLGHLPTLIEYIEYTDKTETGYRVESKSLTMDTIQNMQFNERLILVSIFPTLDRTLIATYHFLKSD
jgi:intergrase/recombinase